jgi:hypothetical protein
MNGTSHENWAGVTKTHPCTTVAGNIDLTTSSHDKIHMQYSEIGCMTFARGRLTGQNTISASFTIMSGEGLFSQASGGGIGAMGKHRLTHNPNGLGLMRMNSAPLHTSESQLIISPQCSELLMSPQHAGAALGDRGQSRPSEDTRCPYCGLRMYKVMVKEYPEFETYLCYACGGCLVYELAPPRAVAQGSHRAVKKAPAGRLR